MTYSLVLLRGAVRFPLFNTNPSFLGADKVFSDEEMAKIVAAAFSAAIFPTDEIAVVRRNGEVVETFSNGHPH